MNLKSQLKVLASLPEVSTFSGENLIQLNSYYRTRTLNCDHLYVSNQMNRYPFSTQSFTRTAPTINSPLTAVNEPMFKFDSDSLSFLQRTSHL